MMGGWGGIYRRELCNCISSEGWGFEVEEEEGKGGARGEEDDLQVKKEVVEALL